MGSSASRPDARAVGAGVPLSFFSSRFAVTGYSLYLLGAMVIVFAAWALLTRYAPPADLVSFGLNAVSKVLGFASVVAGFAKAKEMRLA